VLPKVLVVAAATTYPRAVPANIGALVWKRLSFVALLTLTGALYLWGLDRSGWTNAYWGQIHNFIAGGLRGRNGSSSATEPWVSQQFTATTVGGSRSTA
jgi:hypothetical protein